MLRSWKLGTVFGIGIFIHWTFLLLLAWVLLTGNEGPFGSPAYAGAMLVGVFGCVLLHELGHALMARVFGISTRDITLYPIGGVARLERMSERPGEELLIALAGPAVNVAIAVGLGFLLHLGGMDLSVDGLHRGLEEQNFWLLLMGTNIVLVVFNMIPAFPMDGGRVFRALLAYPLGRLQATEVAAGVGAVFSVLFLIYGFWKPEWVLVLIALFIFIAGRQELAAVRYRAAARRMAPLEMAPVQEGVMDIQPSMGPDFSGFTWDSNANLWVQWRNGRPVSTISLE